MRSTTIWVQTVCVVAAVGLFAAQSQSRRRDDTDTVYTSKKTITALCPASDGGVWIGTTGGIVHCDSEKGNATAYTRADGLSAHEVRSLARTDNSVTAWFADGSTMQFQEEQWRVSAASPAPKPINFPVPEGSPGTHVSAICETHDPTELIAVYGDPTIYTYLKKCLPNETVHLPGGGEREITAICATLNKIRWIGTRRNGVWRRPEGSTTWTPAYEARNEPADHNAQAMTFFHNTLYVSTLQNGLVVRDASGKWTHLTAPTLSTNAPRQMLVYRDTLYVRHGSGVVDRFDGTNWQRNIWFSVLPRKQVSAMATDGAQLYAAQWGGWSVCENDKWTHYLRAPELQGIPITALLPDKATLWIGTQGRGLAEADSKTGTIRRFWNEAQALPDDWVTALAKSSDRLYVGTFVGGLAYRTEDMPRFAIAPKTAGENVTDLAPRSGNAVVVATRHGIQLFGEDTAKLSALVTAQSVEGQALTIAADNTLWVGTRTGIYHTSIK